MRKGHPSPGTRLKNLMRRGIVACPGTFNPITAKLIERAGFHAAYISGAGLHARLGLSDTGLLSRQVVANACAEIVGAVRIPLIADCDTGFGGVPAIPETVRAFENAGVAGIQIEDQKFPKRCGHLPGKVLIPPPEMARKVEQAVRTRKNRDFLIVARTDARGVAGFKDAVSRGRLYREAGADLIFADALESRDEFRRFARELRCPLLANMTEFGKTPFISVREFEAMGYSIVIYPMTLYRVMMKAAEETLRLLRKKGSQQSLLSKMQTRKELYSLIGYKVLGEARRG